MTTPSLVAQIAQLPRLSLDDLKSLWHEVFGTKAKVGNRAFLERRIAHRLQENALRKTEPELLERNRKRIDTLQHAKPGAKHGLMPGTTLTRTYDDVAHTVTVLPDGQFEWQGRHYRSLSVIAREITGTRWSGPAFFGLKGGGR